MSNLSLERLLYDPTDGGPIVGAYITNTSVAVTATALDIRALTNADVVTAEQGTSPWVVSGSVTVSATALDIRALTNADVVTAEQGTSPWVVSGSVTVSATALDIRALTNADVVTVEQGTSPWVVSGSVTVSATALDIRTLTQTDEITAYQGGTWTFDSDLMPDTALASAKVTCGLTEVALPASPLAARKRIMVQNISDKDIYVGPSGVTTASGLLISKGATLALEIGVNDLYGICGTAAKDVIVFEQS